ncbi:hypothetical protein [Sphingomonas bacterium]|uniref:hypothetical protein n=1 Tax=Sphingomonas bacterium TaxID=1895847 RepID=UPI002628D92F|nr:hypothetical protein [Sphingomonas bacterium]MDB5680104.1 hypothetical protein [Sphingomonas bacterium]
MMGWVNVAALVMAVAPLPPAGARTAVELDALATLRYRSAQTETVAARVADAQLVAMRARIDAGDKQLVQTRNQLATLRAGARTDKARIATLEKQAEAMVADLAALKTGFTDELAKRDAQYARDIAILQTAGEQLLATPEGARALALYNEGGPGAFEAADAVLAQIEAARDKAREEMAKKQLGDDRRARAQLALDARDKGLTTTAIVIARWEAVVAADPGTQWDWIQLVRLYRGEARMDDARRAADRALATATDPRGKSVALTELGTIAVARNDLAGAKTAFAQALEIDTVAMEKDATADTVRDTLVTVVKLGNVLLAQGDPAGAQRYFDMVLAQQRALLALDPTSASLRHDVMVALFMAGDVRMAREDLKGAAAVYAEGMTLAQALAAESPTSVPALDDEARGLIKLGDLLLVAGKPDKALATFDGALTVRRALLTIDPESASARDALATALQRVGDGRLATGDTTGARTVYEEDLALARALAAASLGSANAQRGLMVVLWKLAAMGAPGHDWAAVLAQLNTMKAAGLLAASDQPLFAEATARAEGKPWP